VQGGDVHFGVNRRRIEIREYQLYLLNERRLSAESVNQFVSAAKFLYNVTLETPWPEGVLPRARVPEKLPVVLSAVETAPAAGIPTDPPLRPAGKLSSCGEAGIMPQPAGVAVRRSTAAGAGIDRRPSRPAPVSAMRRRYSVTGASVGALSRTDTAASRFLMMPACQNQRRYRGCPAGQSRGEVCPAAGVGTQNQPPRAWVEPAGTRSARVAPRKKSESSSRRPEIQANFSKTTTQIVPPRKQTPLKNQAHAAV
jgi:hypothetical protein